ncbi:MAG: hypothetical protein QXI16_05825 [Sulfolobaceae archaeon]
MNRQLANKLNSEIIRNAKTPHERDLARMRINIIRKAKIRHANKQSICGQ